MGVAQQIKRVPIVFTAGMAVSALVIAGTLVIAYRVENNQRNNGNRAAFEAEQSAERANVWVNGSLKNLRGAVDRGNYGWLYFELDSASNHLNSAEYSTIIAIQQKANTGQPVVSLNKTLDSIVNAKASVDATLQEVLNSPSSNTYARLEDLRNAKARISDAQVKLYEQANGYSPMKGVFASLGGIVLAAVIAGAATAYQAMRPSVIAAQKPIRTQ